MRDNSKTNKNQRDKKNKVEDISLDDFNFFVEITDQSSFNSVKRFLKIMLDFYLDVIAKHNYDEVNTQSKADAKMLFQMFFSKGAYIYQLLDGVSFNGKEIGLMPIIDPSVIFTITRSMYESLCAFELINIIPDTNDKKTIAYQLFVISGLKYRQRFYSDNLLEEQKKKYAEENQAIKDAEGIIRNTPLYKSLSPKYKKIIDEAIKDKNYQIVIEDNKAKKLGWKDIALKIGLKEESLNEIYTYFCLNAHPSYISLIQFRDAFGIERPEFISMGAMAAKYATIFMSVFLSDYIRLFPKIKDNFNNLPQIERILLDLYNRMMRGEKYAIVDFKI